MSGDCPVNHAMLRQCNSCGEPVNRMQDRHVVVTPSWKRCNDVLCYACFQLIMQSAEVVVRALVEGADELVIVPDSQN